MPPGIPAQEATGHVEGWVLTPEGVPAGLVEVTAESPSLQGMREAEANERGYFRLNALPVGTYRVRLRLIGYRPVLFTDVVVRLGATTTLGEIRLDPHALDLAELVVSAERPLIDMASAATATRFSSEHFRELPTDRNFRSIVPLAPNTVRVLPDDETNIAGSTGHENAYYLDGVNITLPQTGGSSANLPFNFIRELEVREGGYEAEYGRATGGIINLITHSGGNHFAGQVFGYFTNDGLTAEPRFIEATAESSGLTEYDLGGSLGGPILRDRLWFFAAYNPSFRRQRGTISGLSLPVDRETRHLFASKLTWQADSRTDVVLTVHGDPSVHQIADPALAPFGIVNTDVITAVAHHGGLVLAGVVRRRLGGRALAELGAAQFTRRDDIEGATERGRTEPGFDDATTGVLSGGFGIGARERNTRRALRVSLSAALGRHALKAGVEYEANRQTIELDASAAPGSPGGFITRIAEDLYLWRRWRVNTSVHNRVPSLYLQNTWRPSSRLTLSLGLRWDGQYLIDRAGDVAQSFTDQWQPRLGLVYSPGGPGSQKLFGSFARFYEQIPLALIRGYYDSHEGSQVWYSHDPRVDPSGPDSTTTAIFVGPVRVEPRRELEGQSLDEYALGYERVLGRGLRAGIRGVYRRLGWAVEDAFNPDSGRFELGNPGRANLAFVPRARRSYAALIFTLQGAGGDRYHFLGSYVLSRSRGNYAGLYDPILPGGGPNLSGQFDFPETFPNSTGLLPNDRPHVLKLSGAYRFDFGLAIGTTVAWLSGSPRNEFGAARVPGVLVFLQPRGSAGRTESVFDANLRLTYDVSLSGRTGLRPRLYLDLFHLGNRRTGLLLDDVRYSALDEDSNPTAPNPGYGMPTLFQEPLSARLGVSLDFGAEG